MISYIDLENIFATHIINNGLVFKICKESLQVNLKEGKKNNPIEKWAAHKRRIQMARKHEIMFDFISNKGNCK